MSTPGGEARCDKCGLQTTRAEFFHRERRSFRTSFRTYCPDCWAREQSKRHRNQLWRWVAILAGGGVVVMVSPGNPLGWLFLNLAWLDVCCFASLVLHEFGHASVARAVGFRIFRILLGTGRTWWRGRLLGFEIEAKVIPLSGAVIAAPRELRGAAWKQFLFVLAGPMTNALLFGLSLLVTGKLWSAYVSGRFNGWFVFALANLAILISNLWPRTVRTTLGALPSDGRLLWRFLIGKRLTAVEESHAARFVLEASVCSEQEDQLGARAWLEKGLALYPQNRSLREHYSIALIKGDDVLSARPILLALLAETPAENAARPILLNNIAYADTRLNDPALLEEADRYSAEAVASLPWHPALKHTRGVVLLALHRVDEALPLLRASASAPEGSRSVRAVRHCMLAVAEALHGDLTAAERSFETAREADGKCSLLPRAELALKEARERSVGNFDSASGSPAHDPTSLTPIRG